MKILLVEDELASRKKMDMLVRSLGHETIVAVDGVEGWEIWKNERPRMVITDWIMPEMDGVELCRKIREAEGSEYTYIMIVTSKQDFRDIVTGLDVGADDFISKPFIKAELAARTRVGERILDFETRLIDAHNDLKAEIVERKRAEEELQKAHDELERRVEERTAELRKANEQLRLEIEERKRAEEQVKASLEEKEVLLREIHHRVKNNMQVIISLLRLQAASIDDKHYANMFKDCQDRIRSMSLVHEKLYQSKDFANVDFNQYVKALTSFLFRSHGVDTNKIALRIEIEDVSLGIETAIPCGLLINELVSNSLKHAFPQDRKGEIKVIIRSINEDEFELTVSDDGVGMPKDLDFEKAESLGLELIKILAEDQLDGQIELDRTAGTKYYIQIKRQKYKPRI